MPQLILHPGRADEQLFPLAEASIRIGRTRDNEIFVPNSSLSRHHARLDVAGDSVVIHDLGSKNGTVVNGANIDRCRLQGGERIRCGQVVFTFVADSEIQTEEFPLRREHAIDSDLTRLSIRELTVRQSLAAPTALLLPVHEPGQRAQAKLRILLKVSQLLSSPEWSDRLFEKILELAFEILDIDRAAILVVDRATGILEEKVTRFRPGVPRGERFYSESIVRHACDSSVAVIFSDAQTDPRLQGAASISQKSICSSMCAPLKPRELILGVLYVDNITIPDRFDSEDLEFLSAFANQAAIALDNSRLYARLEREAVRRNNLLRFFPPAAISKIQEDSELSLRPRETEVTALFSDITGFTAMSSRMSPREIVQLLNSYFPIMSELVFRYQGTLEKYIGDALLAVWGAPYRRPDDPERAVQAAIGMQRALGEINQRRQEGPKLEIHIGLNTGIVAAGNIGSDEYLQYATIGDAINVASRICSAAAASEILLSESTAQRLAEAPWRIEKLAPVPVKGKDAPLQLYRLDWRAAAGETSGQTASC